MKPINHSISVTDQPIPCMKKHQAMAFSPSTGRSLLQVTDPKTAVNVDLNDIRLVKKSLGCQSFAWKFMPDGFV